MTDPPPTAAERAVYDAERGYWMRHADDHFDEADLPFLRWHQEQVVAGFAIPAGELVAEVGCGAGKLFRDHPRVLLVDFSPEILRKARARYPHFLAVCASIDRLPFRDQSLRHVAANNMLHHVKGEGLLDPAVDELARVLADDGRLHVNDRNPTLLHHAIIVVTMAAKHLLRRLFGEFGGCGSFHEPLFTRRDWARLGRRFRFVSSRHYYTAAMWLVDSVAKGIGVVARRDRGFVARVQRRSLPALLWIERHLPWRPLAIERTVAAVKRTPLDRPP